MKWLISKTDPSCDPLALARDLRISAPLARVLIARGIQRETEARRFLFPTAADLLDPFLLKDMRRATARLIQAIRAKEPILLYGDYDVDGTSSLVLLKKVIDLSYGVAHCFVPHRLRDGYGMKSEVVEQAAADGVRLIISVDTGIRANDVVKHAQALNIDVIVTDHHLPETELPPALAVLNPNRPDCTYPEKNLCGAGVALKLADALMRELDWPAERREKLLDSFLKIVAIATVADVVPLTGENRVIVKRGLEGLRKVANPGLRALLDVSGIELGVAPTARQVGFQIAPRINAAGRMASASDVVELFTTSDGDRARQLAAQLDQLNKHRRDTEDAIQQAILQQCLEQPVTDDEFALVFAGEGWHRGVVGIVASRVVARHHRPAFVLSIEDGVITGSGRSIRQFHLLEALESMPELFTKFGGHRQAAGLTLPADKLDEFRARLRSFAATRLTVADFEPELEIDGHIDLTEINDRSVAELLDLAPFGMGNQPPSFVARDLTVEAAEIKNDKHVFARFSQGGRSLRVKAWDFAARVANLSPGAKIDAVLQFEDDPYSAERGYAPWQTMLLDFRVAE